MATPCEREQAEHRVVERIVYRIISEKTLSRVATHDIHVEHDYTHENCYLPGIFFTVIWYCWMPVPATVNKRTRGDN